MRGTDFGQYNGPERGMNVRERIQTRLWWLYATRVEMLLMHDNMKKIHSLFFECDRQTPYKSAFDNIAKTTSWEVGTI